MELNNIETSSSNHYIDDSQSSINHHTNSGDSGDSGDNEILIRIPFFNDSVPALYAMFALASLFVLFATILSAHLIYKHLKYYTQPDHQRYIVRIVFMIPIYAIYSLLSLLLHNYQVYFALLRDCYEAYVLYMFFALCVSYGGGDKNLVTHFVSHPVMRLPAPLFFKFKPNEAFLQVCRMGMLQYVLVRPLITLMSAIFEIFGLYDEGSYAINRFYLYNSIAINVSVTVALYIVVLFYQAAAEELAPYKPLLKFTSIKIVVFFCFWQSVAISFMTSLGWIPTLDGWSAGEVSTGLQNFLICFEMFGVAILHVYAFPYELYRVRAFSAAPLIHRVEMGTVFKSVINSVSQKDMVKETVKSFKGTKITDGKAGLYSGLKDDVFNEFIDIEEIEMGDFTSCNDNNIDFSDNNFNDFDGANHINHQDKNQMCNNNNKNNNGGAIGSAILTGGDKDDLITDDDFFSLMNNDYSKIDFSNFDQDALEEMNFSDDDDELQFTARR